MSKQLLPLQDLVKDSSKMKESLTYQMIVDEGKEIGRHDMVLGQGRKRLGEPSELQIARLNQITNRDQLLGLAERIYYVSTWDELFKNNQ